MFSSKELNKLGLPNHPLVMPLAMKIVSRALAGGMDTTDMLEQLKR